MIHTKSSAKAVIVNDKDEVLVLFRSHTHPTQAHRPDLPGGLVDSGEMVHAALIREISEEIGVAVQAEQLQLLYAETFSRPLKKLSMVRLLYVVKLTSTPEIHLSWEHEDYAWVNKKQLLKKYSFREFYNKGVKYLLKNKLI